MRSQLPPSASKCSVVADLFQISFVLAMVALGVIAVGLAAWQVVIRLLGLA